MCECVCECVCVVYTTTGRCGKGEGRRRLPLQGPCMKTFKTQVSVRKEGSLKQLRRL